MLCELTTYDEVFHLDALTATVLDGEMIDCRLERIVVVQEVEEHVKTPDDAHWVGGKGTGICVVPSNILEEIPRVRVDFHQPTVAFILVGVSRGIVC